jgi:hypothetical protein
MPYVEKLRRELAMAADAGGPDARALAERLAGPLESATRLALLEALSAAAGEITRDLAPRSVDVLLRGSDPVFVVTAPPVSPLEEATSNEAEAVPVAGPATGPFAGEDGGTARMTLRLPDRLKARVEEAAGQQGTSVNAWLVRAISAAFEPGTGGRPASRPRSGRSYTGWVRY